MLKSLTFDYRRWDFSKLEKICVRLLVFFLKRSDRLDLQLKRNTKIWNRFHLWFFFHICRVWEVSQEREGPLVSKEPVVLVVKRWKLSSLLSQTNMNKHMYIHEYILGMFANVHKCVWTSYWSGFSLSFVGRSRAARCPRWSGAYSYSDVYNISAWIAHTVPRLSCFSMTTSHFFLSVLYREHLVKMACLAWEERRERLGTLVCEASRCVCVCILIVVSLIKTQTDSCKLYQ